MKKTFSLILALALVVCLFSFVSCNKKETLYVCNWGEYISDGEDGSLDVIAEFEERFNVNVEYTTTETNETLYSLLKNESAQVDVVFPSDYMIEKLIKEDMLAELNFENIPNFETNIMDDFKKLPYDPDNKYSVPYFWGTVGLVYNTKLYTEEMVGWSNLWTENSAYDNKIYMMDNPRDAFTIALFELGKSINSTDSADWEAAAELLKKKQFDYAMDDLFTDMPTENGVLAPYYAGDCMTMIGDNENLAFFRPERTNIFNDAMCVPKTSKNQELAEKFINFMLEPDIGLANTEYVGYSTPNKAVLELLEEEIKADDSYYPKVSDKWEHMRLLPTEIEALMSELWNDIKGENKD